MATGNGDTHWIEVVDANGLYPAKVLGPYATARQAERASHGVLRLLNVRRYSVAVLSQRELEDRQQGADITGGRAPLAIGKAVSPHAPDQRA